MKHLIKIANGKPAVSSKVVADEFGREHKNLMQNLRSLIDSGHLGELDFKSSSYIDKQNKTQPAYELTERGFLIAMPFFGIKTHKKGKKTAFLRGKNRYFFDELTPPAPKNADT